jgi:hypothetical protein
VGVDERAGRLCLTFLRRVKLGPKTSLPFSFSLARSDRRESLSTTELSNLWPDTTSYPQLKTSGKNYLRNWFLGYILPLIKHSPKGAADYMKYALKRGTQKQQCNKRKGHGNDQPIKRAHTKTFGRSHKSRQGLRRALIEGSRFGECHFVTYPLLKTRRPRRGT